MPTTNFYREALNAIVTSEEFVRKAKKCIENALALTLLAIESEEETPKSILCLAAAKLAFQLDNYNLGMRLIESGLNSNPQKEIEDQLNKLKKEKS